MNTAYNAQPHAGTHSFIHSFIQQLHSTHARHAHARVKRELHHMVAHKSVFSQVAQHVSPPPRLFFRLGTCTSTLTLCTLVAYVLSLLCLLLPGRLRPLVYVTCRGSVPCGRSRLRSLLPCGRVPQSGHAEHGREAGGRRGAFGRSFVRTAHFFVMEFVYDVTFRFEGRFGRYLSGIIGGRCGHRPENRLFWCWYDNGHRPENRLLSCWCE